MSEQPKSLLKESNKCILREKKKWKISKSIICTQSGILGSNAHVVVRGFSRFAGRLSYSESYHTIPVERYQILLVRPWPIDPSIRNRTR